MLTFDSIRCSIPIDNVYNINYKFLLEKKIFNKDKILEEHSFFVKNPCLGIAEIFLNKISGKINIYFSAKLLYDKYIDNFSEKNFFIFLKTLRNLRFFNFKDIDFINHLTFFRVDLSKNLFLNNEFNDYQNILNISLKKNKFDVLNYFNNSSVFRKNPTSKRFKIRIIFYDKFKEINSRKDNKKNFNTEIFKKCVRYEIAVNNFNLFRKIFNLEKKERPNYNNIFLNKKNIFLNIFDEFFQEIKTNDFYSNIINSNMKLKDIEKELGALSICHFLDYDENKIKTFLKSKVKGNISRYYDYYFNLIYKKSIKKIKNQYNELFQEIRNKLVA